MPERVEWLDDGSPGGSPFSPRFGDRYRSESGGLDQARQVFLAGCGLPAAWQLQAQWCVLETGFGLGLNFLVTWQAWKADPSRPRLLHFVSTEAFPASGDDVVRSATAHPALMPLAQELAAQMWGLLPGFHRLDFENGRVQLTLCIGDAKAMLRQQSLEADSVYLDGFNPQKNPDIWDLYTMKAVARCCRRGTRIATWTVSRPVRDALAQAGFVVSKTLGVPPKRDNLQGEYNPPWTRKRAANSRPATSPLRPSDCIVVGAGLAGAACAASLALRGWKVSVLDTAGHVAAGASGLPAGLMAPHVSPDDSIVSRLSRSGMRLTLMQASRLLREGTDWAPSGTLQRQLDRSRAHSFSLPPSWRPGFEDAAADWLMAAAPDHLGDAGLEPSAPATWFPRAAWIKPASLVSAWLAGPGIEWRGNCQVAGLQPCSAGWQAVDPTGQVFGTAPLIVLAAAHGTQQLLETLAADGARHGAPEALSFPRLQAIRGQVSWGYRQSPVQADSLMAMPPFPVNGSGSLLPDVPLEGGSAWLAGASYERDHEIPVITAADHHENLGRLAALLPAVAQQLTPRFGTGEVNGWSGIRCATPGRLPALGRVASHAAGQVWMSTGMGSRGLTFAALCGELLAAHVGGEPLPLERRLAEALWTWR